MQNSFRLGKVFGIDIDVHYTWFIVFALVSWSLAVGFFPQQFPGWSAGAYWLVGAVSSLLLFASVLLHELAHSLVAKSEGIPVRSITLFVFGGVSAIQREAANPRNEFLMAFVGPLASVLIGVLMGVLWIILGQLNEQLQAILLYLAIINLILAVFNLMPAFPLDGGRVFRAAVWWVTGSLTRATQIAAVVGRGFAYVMIFTGLFLTFTGNILGGLWLVLIGWFLNSAAETSYRQLIIREMLTGVRVREIMARDVPTLTRDVTVRELVGEYFLPRNIRALPVVHDSQLVGLVTLSDVRQVPQEDWNTTRVAQIMTPVENLHVLTAQDDASRALEVLGEQDLNQVPVVADGRVVGIITRGHIIGLLQLREELGMGRAGKEQRREENMNKRTRARSWERAVEVPSGTVTLEGILAVPPGAKGVVLFAHGSGSGRFSPRNNFVARVLQDAGLATLLIDLLTEEEAQDRRKVFDIDLLAERLLDATKWLRQESQTKTLPIGYFGASTGAAAALQAAAREKALIAAVVSRGGRPDLAMDYLPEVKAPTLLIVGGNDVPVIPLNQKAYDILRCEKELTIIPGATHLFEEPAALEKVADLARRWFERHLPQARRLAA